MLDIYNVGWKAYLDAARGRRAAPPRERANAERQATALQTQADKMRAKATKAKAAQNMQRRADRLLDGLDATSGRATGWPGSGSRLRRRAARSR